MLHKCVNPSCSAIFRRLRDGRIFVIEVEGDPGSEGKGNSRQLRYFWLCNSCRRTMTVIAEKTKGVQVVPLASASDTRAAS
jgi:hypothetical protein